jgi:hypothetical protein
MERAPGRALQEIATLGMEYWILQITSACFGVCTVYAKNTVGRIDYHYYFW